MPNEGYARENEIDCQNDDTHDRQKFTTRSRHEQPSVPYCHPDAPLSSVCPAVANCRFRTFVFFPT